MGASCGGGVLAGGTSGRRLEAEELPGVGVGGVAIFGTVAGRSSAALTWTAEFSIPSTVLRSEAGIEEPLRTVNEELVAVGPGGEWNGEGPAAVRLLLHRLRLPVIELARQGYALGVGFPEPKFSVVRGAFSNA